MWFWLILGFIALCYGAWPVALVLFLVAVIARRTR